MNTVTEKDYGIQKTLPLYHAYLEFNNVTAIDKLSLPARDLVSGIPQS